MCLKYNSSILQAQLEIVNNQKLNWRSPQHLCVAESEKHLQLNCLHIYVMDDSALLVIIIKEHHQRQNTEQCNQPIRMLSVCLNQCCLENRV